MSQQDEVDPFAELRDWGKKTERKVRREGRVRGARRKLRYVVMAAVAGAVIAATVPVVRAVWPDGDDTPAATASVPDGVTATTTQSAAPTDPFEGTAAAKYPIGEDGITLPPAKAVTGFTTVQVQKSLNTVRAALVAGRLDKDMLVQHKIDGFRRLLAPSARASFGKRFSTGEIRSNVATWIDGAVKLDPRNKPRVSGRVTYKSVVDGGIRTLRVTTNFVWVYAFEGEFGGAPLAVEHDEIVWQFYQADKVREDDRGMWIEATKAYGAWLDCAASRKGLLAPTPKGGGSGGLPSDEDQDALLKPDHPLEITGNCP